MDCYTLTDFTCPHGQTDCRREEYGFCYRCIADPRPPDARTADDDGPAVADRYADTAADGDARARARDRLAPTDRKAA